MHFLFTLFLKRSPCRIDASSLLDSYTTSTIVWRATIIFLSVQQPALVISLDYTEYSDSLITHFYWTSLPLILRVLLLTSYFAKVMEGRVPPHNALRLNAQPCPLIVHRIIHRAHRPRINLSNNTDKKADIERYGFQKMPPELLNRIIDMAYLNDRASADEGEVVFSSLKQLSLVNRWWRKQCVAKLFYRTMLAGKDYSGNQNIFPKLRGFSKAGRHSELPDIRDHVRYVSPSIRKGLRQLSDMSMRGFRHLSIVIYPRTPGCLHVYPRVDLIDLARAIDAVAGSHRRNILASLWLDIRGLHSRWCCSGYHKKFRFRIASLSLPVNFFPNAPYQFISAFLQCCEKKYLERLDSPAISAHDANAWDGHKSFPVSNLKYLKISIESEYHSWPPPEDCIALKLVPEVFPNLEELDIGGGKIFSIYTFDADKGNKNTKVRGTLTYDWI